MIAKETTKSGKLGKLQRLSAALNANGADLPQFEGSRAQLAALLAQAQEMAKQQAAATAVKQEASQQLKTLLTEGERLGTVLQLAVKQHYGIRAEKLAEFGMQPFRGRPRKAAPATTPTPHPPTTTPPPATTPPPTTGGPVPHAATPETV
jgi:hypothetical protein